MVLFQHIRGGMLTNGTVPTYQVPGWVLFQHISNVVGC